MFPRANCWNIYAKCLISGTNADKGMPYMAPFNSKEQIMAATDILKYFLFQRICLC